MRGVEYAGQSLEVQEKMKQTNLKVWGFENATQNPIVQEKMKQTNLEIWGFENASQSPKIKQKKIDTNIINRGVENPSQCPEVRYKQMKNSFNTKQYIFPSGKIELVQGFEPYALDKLLKDGFLENDIIVNNDLLPKIKYNYNNQTRIHYIDIYIKSLNKIIEVKSTYTIAKDTEKIFLKQQESKNQGYNYEIWIMNEKGELLELIN